MKKRLLKIIIDVLRWLIVKHSTQLHPKHLLKSGWIVEDVGHREFLVEPMIKGRDKIWIEFEHHYYRVYHGENRTFIALESRLEWLQTYLFIHNYNSELKTRKISAF